MSALTQDNTPESKAASEASAQRAEALFRDQQQAIYRRTDRLFAWLLPAQWIGAVAFALILTPYTWNGESSAVHIHVWASIFLGGALTVFPVWMTYAWSGTTATRHIIAVAQMLMSALLISLTGGRIETHFHVFGSLVILSLYRDWRVLIPATIVVGLDHFLRGIYWPYSVYGVLAASPWRSIEHAGWVAFEDVFLVISCYRSLREMRSIAHRTAALEASEQNFRQIFEDAPIGMAVVGLDERFRQVNSTFCEMLGYDEEELGNRSPLDLTHPDDLEESKRLAQVMLATPDHGCVEKRYVRKNGDVLWARRTGCVIRDEIGTPRHFLIMVEDVSERIRFENALRAAKDEADRANRAKSDFLSRMSHELRTPMNAILGFGQLLERQGPSETQRSHIRHINTAGRHLLDLINEVLDISRIEAGRLQLSVEPVCVSEVLAEAQELIRPLATERGINVSAPAKNDALCYVLADRQRLKQVMLNLLANGIKYTPAGGNVIISYNATGDEAVRVEVRDTGPGIPPEKLPRLFKPFDRLGAEQSHVEGTGLGLALCQRLVQAMKGSIGVDSVVGQGSIFWIELARAKSPLQNLPQSKSDSSQRKPASDAEKITVLYIEDNLSNLTLIEQILEDEPQIELLTAMQGQIGIDLARQHIPDVILLDLHLPDLPGWDVLERLRADPQTRHIPVVVISADATRQQIRRLMTAGAREYLTKPLEIGEFFRVLDQVTNEAASSRNGYAKNEQFALAATN